MTTTNLSTRDKWLAKYECSEDDASEEYDEKTLDAVGILVDTIYPEVELGHPFKIVVESFLYGKLVILAENKKYKFRISFGGDPLKYLNFDLKEPEHWLDMVEDIEILRQPRRRVRM